MSSRFYETHVVAQSDGAALTAAATASALPAHALFPFPAGFWDTLGQKLIIDASVRISSVITTPGTARYDVRFGSVTIFDSLAILLETAAGYTNVHGHLHIELVLRAIGASANFMPGVCWFTAANLLGVPATAPKPALIATLPWASAPAVGSNFDAGADQVCDLRFTQTVATGSQQLHTYELQSSRFFA